MGEQRVGTLYGVGVGPGDPELITYKAARILKEVETIWYPAEVRGASSVVQRIIAPLNLPASKCRVATMGMSRDRTDDIHTYATVVEDMLVDLRQGQSVAWVTLGDPLFYSTFIYIYEEMRQRDPGIPIGIVPAVTSTSAAAAWAGVPVAQLDDKVAVLPATYGLEHLPAILEEFATVFLLKVHRVFPQLLDTLQSMPGAVQAVYLEKIGTPEQRLVTDLESLRGQALPYFSLVLLRQERQVVPAAASQEKE